MVPPFVFPGPPAGVESASEVCGVAQSVGTRSRWPARTMPDSRALRSLDAVDHATDVVLAGGGGRVGGDVPEGVAGADLDDAGGVGVPGRSVAAEPAPRKMPHGQRERQAEQEDGDRGRGG